MYAWECACGSIHVRVCVCVCVFECDTVEYRKGEKEEGKEKEIRQTKSRGRRK